MRGGIRGRDVRRGVQEERIEGGVGGSCGSCKCKDERKLPKVWPIENPTKQISNGSVCEIRSKPVIETKQT